MTTNKEFDAAVDFLRHDRRFQLILSRVVSWREDSIKDLRDYEDDVKLRKAAAEVTIYTELLDLFEVPSGEIQTKAPE